MARTLFDTAQNVPTPAAGKYADLETRFETLVGLVNEHAPALDKVVTPAGVGAAKGTIASAIADGDTAGGIPVTYIINVPDAADSDIDTVLDSKFEVQDVTVIKSAAGAGNTITVKNGATAITDVMAAAVDKTVTRCATIDPAQNVINAAGTLRVSTHRAAGSMAAKVYVRGVKRP